MEYKKFIDDILKDIPKVGIEDWGVNNELKYVVDTRKLMEELKEFEIGIPNEYYDEYKNEWGNGVLQYLQQILGANDNNCRGDNTYNYGGNVSHDIHYIKYERNNNEYYVAMNVHRSGDVRCNYTDFCLLKFDSIEGFYEIVDEICSNISINYMVIDNQTYEFYTTMFSEYANVYNQDTGDSYEIYCYDDESFKNEIKKLTNGDDE